jgi:hypothetical protein
MNHRIQRYFYPDNLTVASLEYEWDGFNCVFVIASSDDMEKVDRWYAEAFPNAFSSDEEDYRIYHFEVGDLHLAHANDTSGLQAFVGSSVLKDIAEHQQKGVIGVLRFHDFLGNVDPDGPIEAKLNL